MTRRLVRVELGRRSAVACGPRLADALRLVGARWHRHETRRGGWVRIHLEDLDDVLAALEVDGQHVELVNREGRPVPFGGLLGGLGATG